MALSKRSFLALCASVGGMLLLAVLAMTPAVAGGAPVSAALASGGCTATAQFDTQWGSGASGGQIVTVTVTNTSPATTTKWAAVWTLGAGQRVVSAWNATVTAAASEVTAVNASHNGVLAPGASTRFGMQLSGIAPSPVLTCDNGAVTPTTPTSSAPPDDADVTVTQADSQRTVTLQVGQTLAVSLGAEFLPPTVSGGALAPASTTGGYPSGRPLAALYRAVAPGSVDITTHSDYACLHSSPPCTVPIFGWTVHVNVVSSGQTVTVRVADNQSTVRLHVGDTLVVSLTRLHLPPKLSAPGVLVLLDVIDGYPTDYPLLARYAATAPGTVDVSTTTDIACNHAPIPCPSPSVPWTIHVIVTA
jgi:cellulose binding protein with CBM2 domain